MTPPENAPQLTCEAVARESLVERYVASQLGEPEREAFELHYFGCDACFQEMESLRLARQVLRHEPVAAEPKKTRFFQWFVWIGAPVAATLALALVFWPRAEQRTAKFPTPATAQPEANRYAELARFDPPRYSPAMLRSPGDQDQFTRGMASYARQDYAGAIPPLRKAAAGSDAARFFLASCELLTGDAEAAIADYRLLLQSPASAFAPEAHYSLAKALLRNGDAAGAKQELERTVALKSDFADEARKLLAQL